MLGIVISAHRRGLVPDVRTTIRELPKQHAAVRCGDRESARSRRSFAMSRHVSSIAGRLSLRTPAPSTRDATSLITDLTPNTSNCVFQGIAGLAVKSPALVTGDN
jgi:hypothetical protein